MAVDALEPKTAKMGTHQTQPIAKRAPQVLEMDENLGAWRKKYKRTQEQLKGGFDGR